MNLNEHYLWASLIWGSIAGGYMIFGWKQHSLIPFFAGLVMTAVSFFCGAMLMSIICIAIIALTWWLLRQGY